MKQAQPVTMIATVLGSSDNRLLVCDCATATKVIVHTDDAACYQSGQRLAIEYSGAMTMSLPPQIYATSIAYANCR